MSELKAYRIKGVTLGDTHDVYLKSEADKVIAGLKEHVKSLILDNYLNDKELRRQKYKRCLAMAKKCAAECVVNQDIYKRFETRKSEFRIGLFRKWYLRWLAIAEKFKPNSTAQ